MRSKSIIDSQKKYYESNKKQINKVASEYYQRTKLKPLSENSREKNKIKCKLLWDDIIKEKGMDRCQICGYNEHFSVIEFHHINPVNKKYQFNNMYRLFPTQERLNEVDKCIALCANCHRLVHNNVINIYRDIFGWHKA